MQSFYHCAGAGGGNLPGGQKIYKFVFWYSVVFVAGGGSILYSVYGGSNVICVAIWGDAGYAVESWSA